MSALHSVGVDNIRWMACMGELFGAVHCVVAGCRTGQVDRPTTGVTHLSNGTRTRSSEPRPSSAANDAVPWQASHS